MGDIRASKYVPRLAYFGIQQCFCFLHVSRWEIGRLNSQRTRIFEGSNNKGLIKVLFSPFSATCFLITLNIKNQNKFTHTGNNTATEKQVFPLPTTESKTTKPSHASQMQYQKIPPTLHGGEKNLRGSRACFS